MSSGEGSDLRREVDALMAQVSANRGGIRALEDRAAAAESRADAMAARSLIDREMIEELHADGVLSQAHIADLEVALRSSRTIGAAIGIVMVSRDVDQDEAFSLLRQASSHSNRKLRDIAADLVDSARPGL